ncbi:MAG: TrkH family potassium uptake protein [Chloroflexota bacterium]
MSGARTPTSSSLLLIYGFAAIIAIGAALLALPMATKPGQSTSPVDAIFTATSAVCVTGLIVVDTANHWSLFGQAVILALIQIGGFGFMTTATMFLLMFGRRIGLREKLMIGESLGMQRFGGLIRIVGQMAIFTIIIEALGATGFYYLTSLGSLEMPIWKSVFHSISAFNNAGFDLFGNFVSLSNYQKDTPMLLMTALLIILGGISFLVVADVLKTRGLHRLSLDSKLVLSTTGLLLAAGTVVFLFTESFDSNMLGPLPLPYKLLNAFFQSVTARTAGFSTVNLSETANYALFFIMLLMFVDGASGSTAGGIKVNNFSMLIATVWSTLRGREHPGAFGREFNAQQIYRALAVAILSLGLVTIAVFFLSITEKFTFINLLFETVSAFGTVGLSSGITPSLSTIGQLIIVATMFIGRLGPLTLTLALVQRQKSTAYRYSKETVRIG